MLGSIFSLAKALGPERRKQAQQAEAQRQMNAQIAAELARRLEMGDAVRERRVELQSLRAARRIETARPATISQSTHYRSADDWNIANPLNPISPLYVGHAPSSSGDSSSCDSGSSWGSSSDSSSCSSSDGGSCGGSCD
jgi:hypothetical protein